MTRRWLLAVVLVFAGGCASRDFSMRTLPPETPAVPEATVAPDAPAGHPENASADKSVAQSAATPQGESLPQGDTSPQGQAQPQGAAAAANEAGTGEPAPVPITAADAPSMYTYDPWERLNRFTYRFNARFDENVFLPAADIYRRVPTPFRNGVHNFFANLGEIDSVVNYLLQLRFARSVRSFGRFVVNSTIGLGGLIDVADRSNLQNPATGFSATLSTWGVHPGPYLVVPLLGPSTLRDGGGYLADFAVNYGINLADLYRGIKTYPMGAVNAVDQRSNTSFRYFATGSPFEYEMIRFLYVRKALLEDEALRRVGRPPANEPAGK